MFVSSNNLIRIYNDCGSIYNAVIRVKGTSHHTFEFNLNEGGIVAYIGMGFILRLLGLQQYIDFGTGGKIAVSKTVIASWYVVQ